MIYSFGLCAMGLITPAAILPSPGRPSVGDAYHLRPTGGAANVAVAARRGGAKAVHLCAQVGDDEFGKKIIDYLKKQNIDLDYFSQVSGATALCHSAVAQGGAVQHARTLGVAPGIRAATLEKYLQAGDHLVVDVQANPMESYALACAAHQIGAQIYILYDSAAAPPDEKTLHAASWVVMDGAGAAALAGEHLADDDALHAWAHEFSSRHELSLAIHHSPMLTDVFTYGSALRWYGLDADAIDYTGSMDAWLGVLVAALSVGLSPERAAARAAAAASLATLALGAQDAMVQNETLAQWLPDLPHPEKIG